MYSICSSNTARLSSNDAPNGVYSPWSYPRPAENTARPSLKRSSRLNSSTIRKGWLMGNTTVAGPSLSVRVRLAMWVRNMVGEGSTPKRPKWCSGTQALWYPIASASTHSSTTSRRNRFGSRRPGP